MALDWQPGDIELDHVSGFQFHHYRVARHQAEPEAGRFTVMFVVANCQLPVI